MGKGIIMKAKWLPLAAGIALAAGSLAASVTASAVDFHGYFRAGAQASMRGGDVYCGGNGKRGHKVGRLGDECDTYAELSFSQDVYNKANNKFSVHTLVMYGTKEDDNQIDRQGGSFQNIGMGEGDAFGSNRFNDGINHNSGQRNSIRELFVKYDTDNYTIWGGKRYYNRSDIHIMDFYYLNDEGYGAGIENIDTGLGNLDFAVIKGQNDGSDATFGSFDLGKNWRHVYKLDFKWRQIPVGFGTLDANLIYGLPWVSKYQKKQDNTRLSNADSGVLATLDHTFGINTDSLNLTNHFVIQWGTNGFGYVGQIDNANHAGEYYDPRTANTDGVRLTDHGVMDIGNFGVGYALMWAHYDTNTHNMENTWVYPRSGWEYAIVLRPEYKWTEFTRTTLELGYSQMKTVNTSVNPRAWDKFEAKDPDLYKVTLAQQFTPGKGFWARPAIRFYASYQGGDQFGGKFDHAGDRKLNHHNYQFSLGSQVEAWW